MGGERARNLDAAALTAGKRRRRCVPDMGDAEFGEQFFDHGLETYRIRLHELCGSADVFLGRHAPEDRGFLRQITNTEPRAAIHGKARYIMAVDFDRASVGWNET